MKNRSLNQQQKRRMYAPVRPGRHTPVSVGVALALAWCVGAGCQQDARLADATLRDPVVADVTSAGLTLDQDATPEMVAFALLKAIKEDLAAGRDLEAREKAFDKQFALAAPTAIRRQHIRAIGERHARLRESVYKTVRTWAPTLGHYVASFDFTFPEVRNQALMWVREGAKLPLRERITSRPADEAQVLLEAQDPGGDPNAAVVVKIRLAKEEGRWRVWWVGFERSIRHLPTTGSTGNEGAAPEAS